MGTKKNISKCLRDHFYKVSFDLIKIKTYIINILLIFLIVIFFVLGIKYLLIPFNTMMTLKESNPPVTISGEWQDFASTLGALIGTLLSFLSIVLLVTNLLLEGRKHRVNKESDLFFNYVSFKAQVRLNSLRSMSDTESDDEFDSALKILNIEIIDLYIREELTSLYSKLTDVKQRISVLFKVFPRVAMERIITEQLLPQQKITDHGVSHTQIKKCLEQDSFDWNNLIKTLMEVIFIDPGCPQRLDRIKNIINLNEKLGLIREEDFIRRLLLCWYNYELSNRIGTYLQAIRSIADKIAFFSDDSYLSLFGKTFPKKELKVLYLYDKLIAYSEKKPFIIHYKFFSDRLIETKTFDNLWEFIYRDFP